MILDKDSPHGSKGFEIFEYTAIETQRHNLVIKEFEAEENTEKKYVSFYIKEFTKKELFLKAQAETALIKENAKNVLTLDITHFWEAYDNLRYCTTTWDSILSFQNLYLGRGTDGLIDFASVRQWSPELFVKAVAKLKKYYESVRHYTLEVKDAEPLVEEVFYKFQNTYDNFKPFKVCFAIGFRNTGGTVSNKFVLLGTEMITAGKDVDFSEINSAWTPNPDKKEIDIPMAIKGIISHECVHTQQLEDPAPNTVRCNQLYFCLKEGAANFIGELISGNTNKSEAHQYGEKHEAELWDDFKSTLCYGNVSNWMYNGNTEKKRPADLGYFVGYKICQAYFNKASDKQQAIREIIEMDDPLLFLIKSGYDRQQKK